MIIDHYYVWLLCAKCVYVSFKQYVWISRAWLLMMSKISPHPKSNFVVFFHLIDLFLPHIITGQRCVHSQCVYLISADETQFDEIQRVTLRCQEICCFSNRTNAAWGVRKKCQTKPKTKGIMGRRKRMLITFSSFFKLTTETEYPHRIITVIYAL